MKGLILAYCFILAILTKADDDRIDFDDYKKRFSKKYQNSDEDKKRLFYLNFLEILN